MIKHVSLFIAFIVISCAPTDTLPVLRGKELFMALSFHDYPYRNTLYGYSNDVILYKPSAKISVIGNAVNQKIEDVERVTQFLSPYFDLEYVYGFSPDADVYLNIISSDRSNYSEFLIDRENQTNSIIYNRIGAMRAYDRNGSQRIITHYEKMADDFPISRTGQNPTICNAVPVFDDVNQQINTNWKITLPFVPVQIDEMPDFYVANIFVGFNDVDYPEDLPDVDYSTQGLSRMTFPCMLEEVIHSLTFWRDLQDGSDRYFFSRKAHEGSASEIGLGYERDLPMLQHLLSFYNVEGIRPGLTVTEVHTILSENGY